MLSTKNKMAISDTKLRALYGKPYSGAPEVTDLDGLGIRVSPKGVITFQYRFRWEGKQHRIGLGRYPAVTLKDARNKVADFRENLARGLDPRLLTSQNKNIKSPTVKDCLTYWEETYVSVSLRDKTQQLYRCTVIKNMSNAFPGVPIDEITVRNWMDLFTEEEKINQRRARHLLVQLRSAINWCIRRQFIDGCSLMKISPRDIGEKPAVGDKVLTYNELARIWLAIERSRASTSNKLLHQMLMLWGARNGELRLSELSDFNEEDKLWIVPAEKSKTNKIIRRPIFSQVLPLFEKAKLTYGNVLFPGQKLNAPMTIAAANRYIGRIRNVVNAGVWTAHDFRRTLATRLSEEGVAPHVIEKMLGHELGGIMAVYNKHDWIEEQREAYELYAEKIFWHIKKLAG